MRNSIVIALLIVSALVTANPYDAEVSMFEDGEEVTRSYHQMLQEVTTEGLSPLATQVHESALAVFNNPNSGTHKEDYLAVFPRDFDAFVEIFHPQGLDQLYDGLVYINLLSDLGDEYPEDVGEIYLDLASDACLGSDAPGYLQHKLIEFERRYPKVYRNSMDELSPTQRENAELFVSTSFHDADKVACNF